jgi:hypothetical protein
MLRGNRASELELYLNRLFRGKSLTALQNNPPTTVNHSSTARLKMMHSHASRRSTIKERKPGPPFVIALQRASDAKAIDVNNTDNICRSFRRRAQVKTPSPRLLSLNRCLPTTATCTGVLPFILRTPTAQRPGAWGWAPQMAGAVAPPIPDGAQRGGRRVSIGTRRSPRK